MLTYKPDCRFFLNDRPCMYHKQTGVVCADCRDYAPVDTKILVIKLDAIGDVLRTTCILPGLKEKYPNSYIAWITKKQALPVLANNPYVDACWSSEEDAGLVLATEVFDLVLNLDAAPTSARLATVARGVEKLGYGFHERGYVYPYDEAARKWFLMGINDDLKKRNEETYQQIILRMCHLSPSSYEMSLRLTAEEKEFAAAFSQNRGLDTGDRLLGLNTGAGGRWRQKKWTRESYRRLIEMAGEQLPGTKILLYGGPEERERNAYLKQSSAGELVVDMGCDHTLREFSALMSLPDVVVTGDTLAMHIAIALGRRVVVLFGPTSMAEIDVYGRGKKIAPAMDCLGCYLSDCDKQPKCMELISPEVVLDSVREMLG